MKHYFEVSPVIPTMYRVVYFHHNLPHHKTIISGVVIIICIYQRELTIWMTVTSFLVCFILTRTNYNYVINCPVQLRHINCLNKRKPINQSNNHLATLALVVLDVSRGTDKTSHCVLHIHFPARRSVHKLWEDYCYSPIGRYVVMSLRQEAQYDL